MNTYKIIASLALLFAAGIIAAQPRTEQEKRDKIEAYRAKFITEELDLSPEEAQQFWPIYNQYRKELQKIQKLDNLGPDRHPGQRKEMIQAMTDEEVYAFLKEEMDRHNALLKLRTQYYKKFDEVLPIKKVALLHDAEMQFQHKLIRRLSRPDRPPHD